MDLPSTLPGNVVPGPDGHLLIEEVRDGIVWGVRVDIGRSMIGKTLYAVDREDPAFLDLVEVPPKTSGLVDRSLFGSLIYKGETTLFILGRLEDGRHAGILVKDGRPVNGRLVPIDPANEAYRSLRDSLAQLHRGIVSLLQTS